MKSLQTLFIDLKCRSYINCAVKELEIDLCRSRAKINSLQGKKIPSSQWLLMPFFLPHTHLSNNHGKVRINNEQCVFTSSTFCVRHLNF